jgi:glycosyltransferase involved in cell wall biosynthesis
MINKGTEYILQEPRIMYLDTAYTLKMVKDRGLEQEFASRDCGGYFEHVWGVHPIADVPEKRQIKYEGFKISKVEFSKNQTVIEGLSAYYYSLRYFFPLNFLISQIRFTAYLVRLVKRERIGIIMCTDPYFTGLLGLFIKLFTKAKLTIWVCANYDDVYSETGVVAMPRLFRWRWVEKIIERIVFRWSDLVAGGNQNNLEYALKNGAKFNKGTVFPVGKLINSAHLKESLLRDKDELFNTSKAKYHFIYVGRMIDLKFPDDVIRSFNEIQKKVPNAALIMAGEGIMMEGLVKMVLEMGIQDKVYFLGNISQMRLASLLPGCFAVLSPLTGRSLIEVALAGLPIVAYDRDWQVDFLEKSRAGIIVPFRDWQKMAESAVYLINNPVEAKQTGDCARKAGLEACDVEKLYNHERNEFGKLFKKLK